MCVITLNTECKQLWNTVEHISHHVVSEKHSRAFGERYFPNTSELRLFYKLCVYCISHIKKCPLTFL